MRDWDEEYEERAAILEFDAGMSREEAEVVARKMIEEEKGNVGMIGGRDPDRV